MDFEIAIPSYKRSEVLRDKTLKFLSAEEIPRDRVTIFVADQEELEVYQRDISGYKFVVGKKGLSNQRLFIRNYYQEGAKIVTVDDDIRAIKKKTDLSFVEICTRLFAHCEAEKITTFGFYPTNNLFFCKDRLVLGSFYIIGAVYGFINKKDIQEWLDRDEKEDVWYSLRRIELDGAVLRYEGLCLDTTYYAKGGMAESRTIESEKEGAKKVCSLYPNATKFCQKKNGHYEAKIKRVVKKTLTI